MKLLDIYDIDLKYIRDLHNADSFVMSQSPQISKDTRRYLGVVILINSQEYCIPLSSGTKNKYQKKSSNLDLLKIPNLEQKNENGANKTLAVLNINNMVPVDERVITKVDLQISNRDTISQRQRKKLLQKELKWCRDNCELIERRANKVYTLVTNTPDKNRNLTRRCCDFKKLEAVRDKYMTKHFPERDTKNVSNNNPSQNNDNKHDPLPENDKSVAAFAPIAPAKKKPPMSMGDIIKKKNAELKKEYKPPAQKKVKGKGKPSL